MHKHISLLLLSLALLLGSTACRTAQPQATASPIPQPTDAATATTPPEPTATVQPEPTGEPATDPAESAAELLVPEGVPRETYYAAYPLTITLDGDPGDWEGVPRVQMPETGEEATTAVRFAAAADDTYLYLLADVQDDTIITGQHAGDYWNEDSVEFYINATQDLDLTRYEPGVAQITIPPLNIGGAPDDVILGGVLNDLEGVTAVVVATPNGYLVEAAVPLESNVWSITPGHGTLIGFQSHLNGASQLNRDLKLIWSAKDTADVSYQNPSVFGELVFYEIGQPDVVVQLPPTPTPEPTRVPVEPDAAYRQPDLPIADRVADLLARMSIEEKVGQMTLIEKNSIADPEDIARYALGGLLSGGGGYPTDNNTPAGWAEMVDGFQQVAMDSHLGIPLIYGVDAVHGHNNVMGAVIFPHNIGLGAANNPELMTAIGRATAVEMIATGIYWNYAPAVSVPQDIRWGRTYEGYSEETAIVTRLAPAYLQGLQGDDVGAPDTVIGTPKHFIGDGGTVFGSSTNPDYLLDQGDTQVDEETLRAIHLPPYVAALDIGARSIMTSYSSWNGTKMHAQPYLLNDVLKGELGFDGFIVTDWGGIDQIDPDYYTAVVAGINAGNDMNMVPYDYRRFIETVLAAVEAGDISIERIDDAVSRILTVKMEMGLFERPYSNPDLLAQVGSEEHRAIARDAVAQSLVLLKNEGPSPLPLAPDLPAIYVGGEAADNIGIQSGGWSIEWQGAEGPITTGTTILAGIQAAAGPDTAVVYEPFGHFDDMPAGQTSVCIGVVGERPYAEGFGDSSDLRLPVGDLRLLNRMRESCDQLIVVLLSGRPLIITDQIDQWDAVVAAWLPGTEGQGVADGLFGTRPLSGKLPYTWPRSVDQLPFDFATLDPGEPLFPFGYGLTTP